MRVTRTHPTLFTASFYTSDDWVGRLYRVSRSHPRGRKVQWEVLPSFYPDRALIRAYRSGDLDLASFEAAYLRGLGDACAQVEGRTAVRPSVRGWLEAAPFLGDFTLLCFEPFGEPCHRRVLAHWLLERVPSLALGALR